MRDREVVNFNSIKVRLELLFCYYQTYDRLYFNSIKVRLELEARAIV